MSASAAGGQYPRRTMMGTINVDPVDPRARDTENGRTVLIGRRVPFAYASGEPYAVIDFNIPVRFNGPPDAFKDDGRKVTASYNLSEIPTAGNPYRLDVKFSPANFVGKDKVALPDSLPVIVK